MLDLANFEGHGGPSAMVKDLKIDTSHLMGGEGTLMEWSATLAVALSRTERHRLDTAEMDAAVEWAHGR